MWFRRTVAGLALAGLAVSAWLLLAPQQLGGPIAVVSTYGNSMLPTYAASDLVIVARASSYEIGDVVAYRSDELGETVVLHRIVGIEDTGYVTQGDNNDWLDPGRPTDDELMGTARLHVPAVGRLLEVPTPVRAGAVTMLGGMALLGGHRPGPRRARRPTPSTPNVSLLPPSHAQGSSDSTAQAAEPRSPFVWVGWPLTIVRTASAIGVVALILAVAAFSRPASMPGAVDYTHRGVFDYTAEAPRGVVYPSGAVDTGDPIFVRLVDQLEISFAYEFDGPDADIDPSGQLWLELADGSGWSTRSPLGDEQFADEEGVLSLEGTLDVPQLRRTIDRVREQTGMSGGGATVTVTSEIRVAGSAAGQPLSDNFKTDLTFGLDDTRLIVQAAGSPSDGAGTNGAVTDGSSSTSPSGPGTELTVSQPGSQTVAGAEEARLEFAGRGLDVATVRAVALAALASVLAALALATVGASRRRHLDEAARIRLRHGRHLVEVDALEVPVGYGIIDVSEMTALLARAAATNRPLLHHRSATTDTYVVEGDAAFYRYRVDLPDAHARARAGAAAPGLARHEPARSPAEPIMQEEGPARPPWDTWMEASRPSDPEPTQQIPRR